MTKRCDIDDNCKWRLSDIFASDEEWESELKKAEKAIAALPALEDGMLASSGALFDALVAISDAELMIERLFVYARMKRDENNADSCYTGLAQRAQTAAVALSQATAFVAPAITAAPEQLIKSYIKENAELAKKYDFMLTELLRGREHILDARCEELMAGTHEFSDAPHEIFTMLNNADLKFDPIRDEDGKKAPVTHASYIGYLQSPDRRVRRAAYKSCYKAFKGMINTLGAAYSATVKADLFYARARSYESALAAALYSDNVPESLYRRLIEVIHGYLPSMYDYVALRRKLLGVKSIHMYDVFAPLVPGADKKYTYEQTQELVLAAVAPLGEDYAAVIKKAYTAGWIDVYETEGKTSGAYSWGAYGTHPYVLLNHRDDLDSVFTLAHELGHAMHSYYSDGAQDYTKAGYVIFVAEVASTVNEILLTRYLLKTETDESVKKYILSHYLDQFRTTVFRQTMFAEFELLSHEAAERGEALTPESLTREYGRLNSLYYGPRMTADDDICYEWARIPHFYRPFYVYKYATGFSCAVKIAGDILERGESAARAYREFLSGGGSDHPLELLKLANVDLASGEPVVACMEAFSAALAEFTQLMK